MTLTGGPASAGHFSILSLDATSGPSGENPSGQADVFVFTYTGAVFHIQGPVTCLAVSGNTAVIGVQSQAQPFFGVVAGAGGGWPAGHLRFARDPASPHRLLARFVHRLRRTVGPVTSPWSMRSRRRRQRTNARVAAGSGSASRTRGSASRSSTTARRRERSGCRSRRCRSKQRDHPALTRRLEPTRIVTERAPAPHEAPLTGLPMEGVAMRRFIVAAIASLVVAAFAAGPAAARPDRHTGPAKPGLRIPERAAPGLRHRRLRERPDPLRGPQRSCRLRPMANAVSQYDVACFQLSSHSG